MASGADTHTHTYRRANQSNFKKPGAHGRRPRTPGLKKQNSGIKSTARLKVYYDKNPDSGMKSTARSKACYDKDPNSGIKSTVRTKACCDKDVK